MPWRDRRFDRYAEAAGIAGASLADDPGLVEPVLPAPDAIRVAGLVVVGNVAELGELRVASIGCPHRANREVVRWGQASELPRYRCKACSRTLNALTKTPQANLRLKEKWADQTRAMIGGVSTATAAERCGVHYTTAFRWRHRFVASLAGDKPRAMADVIEGDETFILESFKGKRSGMPRKARKRGGKSAKRGLSAEHIPVIVARDHDGRTTDVVLPRFNRVSVAAALGSFVMSADQFCCDGGNAIVAFPARPASRHTFCQRPASQTHKLWISISTTSMPTMDG